jgi:hypothetical protein
MFSRDVATKVFSISENLLPSNGSMHPAFVEMCFIWKEVLEEDSRLRAVKLPYGFSLKQTEEEKWIIVDSNLFTRSVVLFSNKKSSITPVKRFSFEVLLGQDGHIGLVSDWDVVVYRTPVSQKQEDSVSLAKSWLSDYKPRWESYVSPINFERT